jgi:hypothetical protein
MVRRGRFGSIAAFSNSWWSVCLCGLLVGALVYQRWELRQHRAPPKPLTPGELIKPLTVRSVDNNPLTLRWDSYTSATVLYVFSPDCMWCVRNAGSVRILAEKASAYRVIGISTTSDGLGKYLDSTGHPFPVYVLPMTSAVKMLHIIGTPETIVISSRGIVEKVWAGAYSGRIQREIQNTFGVILPTMSQRAQGYSPLQPK